MRSFDQSLPMLCHRVLASILPPFRRIFSHYGITEQQWRILRILWEEDGISQNDIAQRSLLPKQSLVGIIDRLQDLDLLIRKRSATDRRKSAIYLTEKAKKIEAEITPQVNQIYQKLEKQLSDQQWAQLRKMLTQIANNGPE
jgi:homoprotocatechuate degradation regulator HpaR